MKLIDIFGIVTGAGSYVVRYIRDGWLRETTFSAETPRQLMLRWQDYTEATGLNIDCLTAVEVA